MTPLPRRRRTPSRRTLAVAATAALVAAGAGAGAGATVGTSSSHRDAPLTALDPPGRRSWPTTPVWRRRALDGRDALGPWHAAQADRAVEGLR